MDRALDAARRLAEEDGRDWDWPEVAEFVCGLLETLAADADLAKRVLPLIAQATRAPRRT